MDTDDSTAKFSGAPARNNVTLSFLTPTYNRAHTLPRLWESLKRQHAECFEWVVIDDGSQDDTPLLVKKWAAEATFPVLYHRKENGGKNSALNVGKMLVSGEYTAVIDSDDSLLDDASAVIDRYRTSPLVTDHDSLSSLAFRCVDDEGRLIGPALPSETLRCTRPDMFYRYKIRNEMINVIKTEVLRQLKFRELPPPEHVPEGVAYAEIPGRMETLYVDRPVRRYFLNDGVERLTNRWDPAVQGIKWPLGKYLYRRTVLNNDLDYFFHEPVFFWRRAVAMSRYGLHHGRPLRVQFRELTNNAARLLWLIGVLPGMLRYYRDRRQGHVRRNAPGAAAAVNDPHA